MSVTSQPIRKIKNLFEQRIQHALANVKSGSITVIKQDNLIIQNSFSCWLRYPMVR